MKLSGVQFGLSYEQWDAAKSQLRAAIIEAATERRMTWYSEVANKVTVVRVDPYSGLMNYLLGAVFEDEHSAGRPAPTSIVTHKDGDMEPGSGLYDMARRLGYRFTEHHVFWAEQVQDVFTRFAKSSR